ncbi:MAG: hypothetical protein ACRBHB_22460, partial [Arenicella sp.]
MLLTRASAYRLVKTSGSSNILMKIKNAGVRDTVETINYLLESKELILKLTLEHISLVSVAVGLAILTGVPIGIAITANERLAKTVL